MKDNTLKTIFIATILVFVFISVSWAGNEDHRGGRNQSHYNQNNNNHHYYDHQADNSHSFRQPHAFYNNHKQRKHHYHNYRNNHTGGCDYRESRHGHFDSHHAFSPYRHFFSGFYYVPGFSFSFSTGGR